MARTGKNPRIAVKPFLIPPRGGRDRPETGREQATHLSGVGRDITHLEPGEGTKTTGGTLMYLAEIDAGTNLRLSRRTRGCGGAFNTCEITWGRKNACVTPPRYTANRYRCIN